MHNTVFSIFTYGGGMRGMIPAHFMASLESATGLHLTEMIDIFTGPSTGAILNAALTMRDHREPEKPKYIARHLVRFYEREGPKIFPQDSFREFRGLIHDFNNRTMKIGQLNTLLRQGHYETSNLSKALRSLYGRTRMNDSLKSLIIPAYDIEGGGGSIPALEGDEEAPVPCPENYFLNEGGQALWFKNITLQNARALHRNTPEISLYDAVMSSCAAPSYFPCHNFQQKLPGGELRDYACIDGCMFDNPCISYLGAIRPHLPPGTRHIMIVVGTGYTFKSIRREEWNRFGALGIVDPFNELPLINILFHASESALMDAFADESEDNLFIFNKLMPYESSASPNPQIDDASPENIKKLHTFYEEMLEENRTSFENLCELLVSHRDSKKQNPASGFLSLFRNPGN